MSDEFYIGYEPTMPSGLARRMRAAAIILLLVAPLIAGILIVTQGTSSSANFEFGRVRSFQGTLVEFPYPALVTPRQVYWLVGGGKHGAQMLVRGRDGQHVRLSGSLIERDEDRMIEVSPDSIVSLPSLDPIHVETLHSLGAVLVRGEIVDAKCHLGVMKPGEGPTHRDCAVRCLLGSITPMFAPHRGETAVGRVALVEADGRPFSRSLDTLVGRPITIEGEMLARGPLRFLAVTKTAPAS